MPSADPRLPVRFAPLASRRTGEAVIHDGDGAVAQPSQAVAPPSPGHRFGCACCRPRSGAATALGLLFRLRATGSDFDAVLADVGAATRAELLAALRDDLLASARFRLAE